MVRNPLLQQQCMSKRNHACNLSPICIVDWSNDIITVLTLPDRWQQSIHVKIIHILWDLQPVTSILSPAVSSNLSHLAFITGLGVICASFVYMSFKPMWVRQSDKPQGYKAKRYTQETYILEADQSAAYTWEHAICSLQLYVLRHFEKLWKWLKKKRLPEYNNPKLETHRCLLQLIVCINE